MQKAAREKNAPVRADRLGHGGQRGMGIQAKAGEEEESEERNLRIHVGRR